MDASVIDGYISAWTYHIGFSTFCRIKSQTHGWIQNLWLFLILFGKHIFTCRLQCPAFKQVQWVKGTFRGNRGLGNPQINQVFWRHFSQHNFGIRNSPGNQTWQWKIQDLVDNLVIQSQIQTSIGCGHFPATFDYQWVITCYNHIVFPFNPHYMIYIPI